MAGTLYIVSTPIGNLEDITQRALRVLRDVDLIACEDTRHTRKLLTHFGINTKTISYHEHNERERADELCKLMLEGKEVALVSDAGTPLISDPGFRITRRAIEKGIAVVPIPGPTAFATALAGSGLPPDQFLFVGFLPARANARRAKLEELRAVNATLIMYEAPHRIAATLGDALDVLGDRDAAIGRELTKVHEEFVRGRISQLIETFTPETNTRGELVLVVSGATGDGSATTVESAPAKLEQRIRELEGEGLDRKEAMKKAARELGLKRDEAYRLVLAHKNRRNK